MDELDNASAMQTHPLSNQDNETVSSPGFSQYKLQSLQKDTIPDASVTPLTRHIYEFIEKGDYQQVSVATILTYVLGNSNPLDTSG